MITSKIKIREHICEYAIGKFSADYCNPVKIPASFDLYHVIWDLVARRPYDRPVDSGNLEIVIPNRQEQQSPNTVTGKNPETFNYFSDRSAKIIDFKFETMMFAELHDLLDENKHRNGIEYQVTVHIFINKYNITSISEEALLKNYYRWRKKVKRLTSKRKYIKQPV